MIKKILVALDNTAKSEKALDYAVDLANIYSAELLLISVVPYRPIPMFTSPFVAASTINPKVMSKFLEVSRIHYRNVLSKSLNNVNKINPTLNVSAKLFEGSPANRIVEIAQDEDVDIIIVADKHRSRFHKFFLGSVRDSIVNNSEVPVLVVK